MPFNPLDLFNTSDSNAKRLSSTGIKPSSPIQETQAIKELRLQEEHERLLKLRNQLKEDITNLENEWNKAHSNVESDSLKNQKEENELIFRLLLNTDNQPKEINESDVLVDGPIEEELVQFDAKEFSTAPLQDWDLRISYMKKFYPFLEIMDPSSKVSLSYDSNNKPQLGKIITFRLVYRKHFQFDIAIYLKNFNKTYSISQLNITKISNNKYNTILLQMTEYYQKSRNINSFLYSLNDLHSMITDRKKLFDELQKEYEDLVFESNKIITKKFELIWDFMFDQEHGSLTNLILVGAQYTNIFQDMLSLYGSTGAIRHFIESNSS